MPPKYEQPLIEINIIPIKHALTLYPTTGTYKGNMIY